MISDNEFVDQMAEMTKRHIQRRNSPMINEAQINAAEQAKEHIRVETHTEANVGETHESRLRHMVAIMDEADAKTILDVLVIKHPFTVIDALKEYFQKMDRDLKEMRRVFTIRELKESEVCREDEVM